MCWDVRSEDNVFGFLLNMVDIMPSDKFARRVDLLVYLKYVEST